MKRTIFLSLLVMLLYGVLFIGVQHINAQSTDGGQTNQCTPGERVYVCGAKGCKVDELPLCNPYRRWSCRKDTLCTTHCPDNVTCQNMDTNPILLGSTLTCMGTDKSIKKCCAQGKQIVVSSTVPPHCDGWNGGGPGQQSYATPQPTSAPSSYATPQPTGGPWSQLSCNQIKRSIDYPVVGSSVTFTCTGSANATRYEFRYRRTPDQTNTWTTIDPQITGSNVSKPLAISVPGHYQVQCRPCVSSGAGTSTVVNVWHCLGWQATGFTQ